MKKIEDFCPIRDIISQFGDKWSVLVLLFLHRDGVMRFSVLARSIPDVSQKMLTTTLRTLESYGLVARQVYAEVPPRVEYALTPLGESLWPHLQGLIDWALEHREACMKDPSAQS